MIINYYKHKHKEKILNRKIKSSRASSMERARRVKLLKRELRMKLIEELIIQIGVGSIEIADLLLTGLLTVKIAWMKMKWFIHITWLCW